MEKNAALETENREHETSSDYSIFHLTITQISKGEMSKAMNLNFSGMINAISESEYSRIWFFDNPKERSFFFKQFLSGAFITIAMTGLDSGNTWQVNSFNMNLGWFEPADNTPFDLK